MSEHAAKRRTRQWAGIKIARMLPGLCDTLDQLDLAHTVIHELRDLNLISESRLNRCIDMLRYRMDHLATLPAPDAALPTSLQVRSGPGPF